MAEQKASLKIEVKHILSDVRDLLVLKHLGEDRYVYVAKPSLEAMRQFYEQSISNPEDRDVDVFQKYWQFDEKEGIKGSSTFLTLRFDKQALRPNGLWIPGLLEAKVLESKGKLENGVCRDYGIVVYKEEEPNKQVAETLVSQAKASGLELPLIVPFRALDYVQNKDRVELDLLNSGKGIIQGKEAQAKINSLNYKANSGVQRFFRYGLGGSWDASWGYLGDSDDYGRVDWVCGEETADNLREAHEYLIDRKYGNEIARLRINQGNEIAQFEESLRH